MKIKMMTLAAILCCAMSSMMFTACGSDDDDDNNKTNVDDVTPVAARMEYSFYVSDGMLAALDMTVEYYDDNGKLTTEKLTQNEWTKTVKVAKLPVSLGACLKVQIKDGVDENKYASYTYGYTNKAYSVTATNKVVDKAEDNKTEAVFLLPYLTAQEDGIIMSFLYNFSDKGQVVAGSWEIRNPLLVGSWAGLKCIWLCP